MKILLPKHESEYIFLKNVSKYLLISLTGDTDLVENYSGPVEMSSEEEQKYLWFILSSSGDIMAKCICKLAEDMRHIIVIESNAILNP